MADQAERKRFDQLWRAHHQPVARFVARRLPAHDDGADVVSEVFLTAWRRLDELPSDPAHALPWLYGVARKSVANRLRGARRSTALQARLASELEPPESHGAESAADSGGLVCAFNELSVADREAIALVTWEGLPPRQAAAVVGVSAARFRVRLHRAKQRLRDRAAVSVASDREHHVDPPRPQGSEARETL